MSFTNIESTQIAHLVGVESAAFTESVSKMSSGKRLIYPAMDAAGLSMEVKLSSSGERHKLAMQNMLSAVSRTQTQISLLQQGMKMLERMEELSLKAMGPAINAQDRENYNKEFQEIQVQYQNIFREKLFGSNLFGVSDCGGQTIKVANDQSGSADEHVFEIDTVTGSGLVNFDQFAFAIPDLFQVYHGDVLIHERVTGASFMSTFVGGLHSGNPADVSEYFGNGYTPEPFQDFGEDGVAGTGDAGEGNGIYDYGESFTDLSSGTRDGNPIFNGNYDGYGPQQAAYLAGQFYAGSQPANPSPGDQPGTRSVFKFGPDGRDINGNPYQTDSTTLRFVVNQGGATNSATDLTPSPTEWEYEIEIIPESPNNAEFTVMTDGHGSEVSLESVNMSLIYNSDILSVENAQSSLDSLKKAKMCTVEALSQASANLQRLQGEISENEKRIVNNERALSSISDLDVAAESTRLAVAKLKYESAARLLQNAQIVPQAILSLLTEENL